jgi:phosphate transport system substrate-binding protein
MKKAIFLLTALSAVTLASAQKLVIKGSDTLGAKLVPMLAEGYKASHPGVTFEIAAEGSTTGIAAIVDGTAQIGMSSRRAPNRPKCRPARPRGVSLKPTIVRLRRHGRDRQRQQPDQRADQAPGRADLHRRYHRLVAGRRHRRPDLDLHPHTSSGSYSDFKELAMKKRDYAGSSQKMAGNEAIAAEVAKNANGIGYVALAYLHDPGIKTVAVDGTTPNEETVQAKQYPYSPPDVLLHQRRALRRGGEVSRIHAE